MRMIVARLLIVLGGALCLWVGTPGSASASDCGGSGFRAGTTSGSLDGVRTCNQYAANGARVLGGTAAALAIGLAVLAYRRGARATRAAYAPAGYAFAASAPAPDERSKLERFAASALAGELGARPWTRAVLRVNSAGETVGEVHRPDGVVEAIATPGEAASTLLELREPTSGAGPGGWQSATLTLSRTPDGQVDFTVDYDYPPG